MKFINDKYSIEGEIINIEYPFKSKGNYINGSIRAYCNGLSDGRFDKIELDDGTQYGIWVSSVKAVADEKRGAVCLIEGDIFHLDSEDDTNKH